MKVGEYFRTPWGDIGKITNIPKHDKYQDDGFYLNSKFVMCGREAMKELKSTPNIIELVEYMDLLYIQDKVKLYGENHEVRFFNPVRVDGFTEFEDGTRCIILNLDYFVDVKDLKIKGIITHEQLDNIVYKVGD